MAVLDASATSLVTIGLVNVGSATYTVIYSSAAAWTALLSVYYGRKLGSMQVLGVILVSCGLLLNGVGHVFEDETRTESGMMIFVGSCVALLMGTILHSVVMVQIEETSRESKGRTLRLATEMGKAEVGMWVMWNFARVMVVGVDRSMPMGACLGYALLSLNQAVHALAFFNVIGSLGAVGSAVLKGFLALNTFGLAAALFCEKGHSEQCLTPLKTASMLLVFIGGLMFGLAFKRKNKISAGKLDDDDLPV